MPNGTPSTRQRPAASSSGPSLPPRETDNSTPEQRELVRFVPVALASPVHQVYWLSVLLRLVTHALSGIHMTAQSTVAVYDDWAACQSRLT